jgi:excisionase family DNA binding protein
MIPDVDFLLLLQTNARGIKSCATEEQMKNLLTVAETAEALNIKSATVRAWLLRRKLPRVNCGRAVRIPAEAVMRFIERNTVPAREERR